MNLTIKNQTSIYQTIIEAKKDALKYVSLLFFFLFSKKSILDPKKFNFFTFKKMWLKKITQTTINKYFFRKEIDTMKTVFSNHGKGTKTQTLLGT